MSTTTSSLENLPTAASGRPIDGRGSPEFALLLLCARRTLDAAQLRELRALVENGIDWTSLLEAAHWQNIMPLLHLHLRTALGDPLPPVAAETLRQIHDENAAHARKLSAELFSILGEFQKAGLPALPFKGPVLAVTAFGSVTARHCTNLDLLVNRADVTRARKVLLARGYQPVPISVFMPDDAFLHLESKLAFRHATTGLAVDLHHQIVPRRYCYRVSFDALLARARPFPHEGTAYPSLSPADTLLVLCLHAIKNGFWPSLKQVADVAAVLESNEEIRWDVLIQESTRGQCERAVYLGLLLAQELLGAEIPSAVLAAIRRDPEVPALAAFVQTRLTQRERGFANLADATRVHLRLRKGVRSKARYLFCILTTPSERDFQFLKWKVTLAQSYPIRLLKFAGKMAGQIHRAIFRR